MWFYKRVPPAPQLEQLLSPANYNENDHNDGDEGDWLSVIHDTIFDEGCSFVVFPKWTSGVNNISLEWDSSICEQ